MSALKNHLFVLTLLCGPFVVTPVHVQTHTPRFTHLTSEQGLSNDIIRCVLQDSQGFMWFGTQDGLNKYDGYDFTVYRHRRSDPDSLSSSTITALYQDRGGTLWIGTTMGLDSFAGGTARFTHYPDVGEEVAAIYEDATGTLWIDTSGSGLFRHDRATGQFIQYLPDPADSHSLSDIAVMSIYEDDAETLWLGTADGRLDVFDRTTEQFSHYRHDPAAPHSLSHDRVEVIYQDRAGTLLNAFDRASGHFRHYFHDPDDPGSPSSGAVKAILEDHTHALWIGLEDPGGICRFDPTRSAFTCYEYDPANPDSFINTFGIRAIYEDRAGDLWLGTCDGLVHFDRDRESASKGGTFTQYEHDAENPHSLSSDFVWSIYQDQAGIFWIATAEGLNRFDQATGQFVVYTTEDGLANDNVMCILADEQDNLWLGTDSGLSQFDPRTETFKNYDVSDGLASNAIMLAACHQSESGEMFFGTLEGFNAFYPSDVKDNPHIPPIVLTAFRKFDQVVEFDTPLAEVEEITLSYADNFFAFEFSALDYVDPAKNQYAYQLEGFDQDWIYCGTRRYASYTNLPPGDYVFRVKGTNNDGVWNEAGRAVNVTITPPFWETWWFRIVAGALVLGVMSVVVRARLRNVAILRESEARFRALFENAPLCVFELDMTQTPPCVIRANRRAERVYGWSVVEFTDAPLDKIFPSDAWPALERTMNTLSAGETLTLESTGLRRDGTEFPVHVSATGPALSRIEGEPGHDLRRAILAIEDITAEKERRRIAREIHDGLAQDLAGLRFRVGLWHKLVDDDPAQMHAELDGFRELLSRNIHEVRRSIFALRPVTLDELGFYPALCQFIDEFGEQNQLHVDLHVEGPTEQLPSFLELVLFRIIQESLNNVSKHAQAQMAWVELDLESPDVVTLAVRDDGVGFDPAILDQAVQRGHLGLKQMRERVENLKGMFELRSQPGSGTEIQVVLPLVTQSHTEEAQRYTESKGRGEKS